MKTLVETRRLNKHFPILKGLLMRPAGAVKAVDGVDLAVKQGQWMGLVGESGCGKTTLGKTIMHLLPPTSGHIYFDTPESAKDEIDMLEKSSLDKGRLKALRQKYDLSLFKRGRLKAIRKEMQLVQQDPYSSLNPRMRIRDIVAEPLAVHKLTPRKQRRSRVTEFLKLVGLTEQHLPRYPHQFSGGQRQRIAIARALATSPSFIILDEPTSALDVSVQAQILNLLTQLKEEQGLTYLYITHDLAVAESVCDTIAVMYLGKIVEVGEPLRLLHSPQHPYTRALVLSTPIADPTRKTGILILPGEVPSPANPPPGCRFHPRCDRATSECMHSEPLLTAGVTLCACFNPLG
jgi:oligopeptide/dipeptide ABC transporter ATP-binding protein